MTTAVRLLKPGIITPHAVDLAGLRTLGPIAADPPLRRIQRVPPPTGLLERDMRRMAPLTRYALYAADSACQASGLARCNADICLGITHGTTSYLTEFHDYLFDHGPEATSPNAFSSGVNNASLGAVARHLKLSGRGVTLMGFEQCGLDVLEWAAATAARGGAGLCYAGCAEEYSALVEEAYHGCGWHCAAAPPALPWEERITGTICGVPVSEGGVFFPVTGDGSAIAPDAPACRYRPLDIADSPRADVIICNAGAGPQDGQELRILRGILARQSAPPCILFPKMFLGETFAAGALLAVAVGWDILVNHAAYPVFPVHDSLRPYTTPGFDPGTVRSVLVIAGGRDGVVCAGVMTK